jgi:hypothetical protein
MYKDQIPTGTNKRADDLRDTWIHVNISQLRQDIKLEVYKARS